MLGVPERQELVHGFANVLTVFNRAFVRPRLIGTILNLFVEASP